LRGVNTPCKREKIKSQTSLPLFALGADGLRVLIVDEVNSFLFTRQRYPSERQHQNANIHVCDRACCSSSVRRRRFAVSRGTKQGVCLWVKWNMVKRRSVVKRPSSFFFLLTSTETVRTIRDGEPRTATSSFTDTAPSSETSPFFYGALRPQKPYGLLRSGEEWDGECRRARAHGPVHTAPEL